MGSAQEETASASWSGTPASVAIIGYGESATRYHLALLDAEPRLRVAAIVTSDRTRQARAARELSDIAILSTPAQLWEIADRIDLVVVATPVETHVELALQAFDADLDVVVEKPLAPSADDARTLTAAANDAGRMLTVFQNRRWDPGPLTAQALIDDGTLGRVLRAEWRFELWAPGLPAAHRAGGLLLDIGSHTIDQATRLFGDVDEVYAELARADDAFIALTHRSGVHTHQWTSVFGAIPGPALRLVGDRGSYVKPAGRGAQPEPFTRGAPRFWEQEESAEEIGHVRIDGGAPRPVPSRPCAWPEFYRGVADAVHASAPVPVDPQDAVRTLEIFEACVRSSETGAVQDIAVPIG